MTRYCIVPAILMLATVSEAQVPHILGTWTLNRELSEYPGPMPQSEVRRYRITDDGFVIGLAVIVDAEGNPEFLQFAARTDGEDYPEYSSGTLAQLQMHDIQTPLAYAEVPLDEHTIEWFDKFEGEVYAHGTRAVSEDGQTLTITANFTDQDGEVQTFALVYDRH
jgi:hypothetical protein